LIKISESAVLNTHDFLKEEDFTYYKEQMPVYFKQVTLWGFEENNVLVGFMRIAKFLIVSIFVNWREGVKGIGMSISINCISING